MQHPVTVYHNYKKIVSIPQKNLKNLECVPE